MKNILSTKEYDNILQNTKMNEVSSLINALIDSKDELPYLNINNENRYTGWVYDFHIKLKDNENMTLNLKNDNDLFLLFALASAWSRTGSWENAAYFVTYLKLNNKGNYKLWLDDNFVNNEIKNRQINSRATFETCKGTSRKKVSFRSDYYPSLAVLASNWREINKQLKISSDSGNYLTFIDYLSNISGLGSGKNKMKIKIPLILRELRCQNIYDNIPGSLCCVADKRVIDASYNLGIKLPHITNMKSILKASAIIYNLFKDLYDIPLFAYEDLENKMKVESDEEWIKIKFLKF